MTRLLRQYRSMLVVAAALFVTLGMSGTATANPHRVVRGETIEITGEFHFTFWKDYERYYRLDPEDEQRLLANPKITAPAGVEVSTLELSIRKESHTTSPHPGVRGTQTVYTYDRYVITGRWLVKTSANCGDGDQPISIYFPEIVDTATRLQMDGIRRGNNNSIREPAQSTLKLNLKVFPDRESLQKDEAAASSMGWGSRIFLIVIGTIVAGCLLMVVVSTVMVLFSPGEPKKPTPSTPTAFHDEPERRDGELTRAEVDAIVAMILNKPRPRG